MLPLEPRVTRSPRRTLTPLKASLPLPGRWGNRERDRIPKAATPRSVRWGGRIRRKPRYRYPAGLNRPEKSPSQPDQESNEEQDDGGGEKTRDGLQRPQGEVPERREQEVSQGLSPWGGVGNRPSEKLSQISASTNPATQASAVVRYFRPWRICS